MKYLEITCPNKNISVNLEQVKTFSYDKDTNKTTIYYSADLTIDIDGREVYDFLSNFVYSTKKA